MKNIFSLVKIQILLVTGVCITSCEANVSNKELNLQPKPTQVSVENNKVIPKDVETFRQKVKRVNDECEVNAETEWKCKDSFMSDRSKLTQDQKDIIKHTFNYSDRLSWAFPERAKTPAEFRKVAVYKASKAQQEKPEGKEIMEGQEQAARKKVSGNCDMWCKTTLATDINDIQKIRKFIIDWESRTKGESQAESDVGERSDASIYGQFRAIRHYYDNSFPLF